MFLSRLILDPRSRQVWNELAQPYEMHRTLMRAFPEVPSCEETKARDKFSVLFRADVDEHKDCVTVYVQSSIEPEWSFLSDRNGYLLEEPEPPKEVASAYEKLQNRQVLLFRLRANPTKRILKATNGESYLEGKRVGLLREEEQIDWLMRKGKERERGVPGGFEILMKEVEDRNGEIRLVPRVNVSREGKQIGHKREEKKQMTHLAVRFDGLLRITDAEAFRETLVNGIGSAKAFGFGLLSIAKV
jgi:CRISPR system Cascade subunit CasE